jgi:hypothetical protein
VLEIDPKRQPLMAEVEKEHPRIRRIQPITINPIGLALLALLLMLMSKKCGK